MKWIRLKECLPPLNTQVLIIVEVTLPNTSDGTAYHYYISSGELTLKKGLRVDALEGRELKFSNEPFMWSEMVTLPFESTQTEKLSDKKQ